MNCPFCNKEDYDLVGLKAHLTGGGLFGSVCEAMENVETLEEERQRQSRTTSAQSAKEE